ncbi:hypothetical protein M8J77_025377 [Diaphorina citri]|nr:hypothetical protein M8J77_025377 [Diaphorina citri]
MPFISSTDSSAFEGSFPPSGQEIALSTQLIRSEDRWLCKVVSLSREMFSVSRAFFEKEEEEKKKKKKKKKEEEKGSKRRRRRKRERKKEEEKEE